MFKLRDYQEEAIEALFDYFQNYGGTNPDGTPVDANPLIGLPTGTGKAVVQAFFIKKALERFPNTRIIAATHVKELIKQNSKKVQSVWPLAPIGVYSAGLKSRDFIQPVVFGGIQSMRNKPEIFGRRDLLLIDEAHLLSPNSDTSYVKFIDYLRYGGNPENPPVWANPYLKVIGFTATPYRLGLGHMTNGSIFTHMAYDITDIDGFDRLLAKGYICPLIPKKTKTELDVSNVGMSNGDFKQNELQNAVDQQSVTYSALQEVVEQGYNRASWLIFATGIEHAVHIHEMLNSAFGIPTGLVHSGNKDYKRNEKQNEADLEAWKRGELRAIVNMNSLTTGIDHPPCDLIAVLRPTMSPGLWVQMLGRGTRPFDYFKLSLEEQIEMAYYQGYIKENCIVLDFAGNTRRLGPINDPVIPKPKGKGPPGDAPVKICEKCATYNHASARVCVVCDYEFPINTEDNISAKSSNLELLRSNMPQFEPFQVDRVVLTSHESKAGNSTIKVAYFCGLRTFFEYISVESTSTYFKHKSKDWFRQRYHYSEDNLTWGDDVPPTNKEILALAGELRWPTRINVWLNKKSPEIMGYEF